MRELLICLGLLLLPVGASAANSPAPEITLKARATTFLVVYRAGPAWVPGKAIRDQPPKGHGPYLMRLYREGKLRMAGPFDDDSGGAVLLDVPDMAAARAIVEADPAVVERVFSYTIQPWALVPWERFLRPAPAR
jgi:uncharacterized protein